jgi:hypothetical protein
MDGRSRVDQDRSEFTTHSVPIPIVSTAYEIGMRELMASRAVGSDIDTYEAVEAGQAIAEEWEYMAIDGFSEPVVQSHQVYGLQNHPDRESDTAANYGGGDFGTLGNGYSSILGAIETMAGLRYFGPFNVYIANTQYHQLLDYQDDGTGDVQLDRILALPQINSVKVNDFVDDGELLMVQMDSRVLDLRVAMGLENRQWEHPDGSAVFFKVMEAMTLRLKPDYRGNLGVLHMTSC